MTNTISFMGANFVARELGYHMTGGWGQGDQATNERFKPLDTFGERFGEILAAARAMGFEAVDVWMAHLNWAWASPEHVAVARDLLDRHGLTVASLAGGFGDSADDLDAACRLALSLGTNVLGGNTGFLARDRAAAAGILERHDVRLGIENHPGVLTPEEVMRAIGDGGNGRVGATVDTGWYGTAQYDAVQAIKELGPHIFHVHLKDVLAPGSHETCRYGRGVVPIEGCVRALQEIGYQGAISVEHEPENFDPTEDCTENLRLLREWLAA